MKTTDFEKWLEDVCFEQNPTVLDDDMPDFFDDWIGNLSSEDFIAYANEYAKQDRHTIHTALREGIEGAKGQEPVGDMTMNINIKRAERHKALDDTLTLLKAPMFLVK